MENIALTTLEEELVRDEGFRLTPYADSRGYLTIGVGHLLDPRLGGGITQDMALYILRADIKSAEAKLDATLPWWRSLTEARQRALANMCFNLGITGLLCFKMALAAAEKGDFDGAAGAMLDSKWAKQVGARAARLAQMMREG